MEFIGKYRHEKSENLDGYFKAVGVPYLIRIMITKSNPDLEINKEEDDVWIISVKSLLKTAVKKFKLGEEYIEEMPGTKLKCITTVEDGKLITRSVTEIEDHKSKSTYELNGDQIILTLLHEASGQEAKRYFRKMM